MNETDSIVIGLDIGSYQVRAVAGSLTGNGAIQIDGYEEAPFSFTDSGVFKGQIVNVKHCIDTISSVLKKLSDKCDSDISSVNVNISGLSIESTKHEGVTTSSGNSSMINLSDVGSLITHVQRSFNLQAGHTILHTLPWDFMVNHAPASNPIGRVGVQVSGSFSMISMPKVHLDTLQSTIVSIPSIATVANTPPYLSIDKALLSSLADSYSVLSEEDKRNGVVVVNIGNELTEISVFHKQSLRYRKVIPVGGQTITSDLAEAFKLQIEEAEKLKLVYSILLSLGSITENHSILVEGRVGLPSRQILVSNIRHIIDLRLREIALIVLSEITRSGLRDHLIDGCILTGGTANMYQISPLFNDILYPDGSATVRLGNHLQKIDYISENDDKAVKVIKDPKYATAVGLMLASLKPFDTRFPEYTGLLLQPVSPSTRQVPLKPIEGTDQPTSGKRKDKDETRNILTDLLEKITGKKAFRDMNDAYDT